MLHIPVVNLGVSTTYINDPSVSYLIAESQAHHKKVLAPLRQQFIPFTASGHAGRSNQASQGSHKFNVEMAKIRVRNLISVMNQSAKSSGTLDDMVSECIYELVGMMLRSIEVGPAAGKKHRGTDAEPLAQLRSFLDPKKYRLLKREVASAGLYALDVSLNALDEISALSTRAEKCIGHFDDHDDQKDLVMDYLAAFMRAMVSIFICLFVLDGTLVKLKRVLQQQVPRYTINAAHGLLGRLTTLEDAIVKAEIAYATTKKSKRK